LPPPRGGGNFRIAESVFKKYIACLWKIAQVTSRKVVYTLIVFNRILGFILYGFDPWGRIYAPSNNENV
jgi:hypothetical protein